MQKRSTTFDRDYLFRELFVNVPEYRRVTLAIEETKSYRRLRNVQHPATTIRRYDDVTTRRRLNAPEATNI
ncbi:unnamed protein product, partial [Iphiclides podalirius]